VGRLALAARALLLSAANQWAIRAVS
jgi:hypothetical protein